jgi:hypothetical protein
MRCAIFCTCYLDRDPDAFNEHRYRKWIDYYVSRLDALRADCVFLMDDGSEHAVLRTLAADAVIMTNGLREDAGRINIARFDTHLGRDSGRDSAGWWRSFTHAHALVARYGVEKLIHLESDFFVISDRLIRYIADLRRGWTSLFSRHHGFAETAIQVICADAFGDLERLSARARASGYRFLLDAESVLPITYVNKDFVGDRFGELRVLRSWSDVSDAEVAFDYVGQLPSLVKPPSSADIHKILMAVKRADAAGVDGARALLEFLAEEELLLERVPTPRLARRLAAELHGLR